MKEYYQGKDFWKESKEKDKRNEYPINEEIVKQAEVILGVELPLSYIELLNEKNGGELNFPYILLHGIDDEGNKFEYREEIRYIEGICMEHDDISIMSSKELLEDEDTNLPSDLIVLWSDYHHWLVLDYRDTKVNPSVVFIGEDYSGEGTTWYFRKLANTFDEFLTILFRLPPLDPKKLKGSYKRK